MTNVTISVPFDCGNIDTISAADPANIRLNIRDDGAADFKQWFYFRVDSAPGPHRFVIENAGQSSYTGGWPDYRTVASHDLEEWFRVDTRYEDGKLVFEHDSPYRTTYYAYFAPYSIQRYREYIGSVIQSPLAEQLPLTQTVDGEAMDLLRFGEPAEGKKNLWIIARQHPGETMGSWWIEGFLDRMTDHDDATARALREQAVMYVVPLVNIDGSRRGHLRTNAKGADLNREWAEPSADRSPEVLAIRNAMDEFGCDFFLDAHGDEAIANNFLAGAQGVPKWNETHADRFQTFSDHLKALSPAFQDKEGYPIDAPGQADLRIAANQIAERFDCLSMTLEMPFKDAAILPDEIYGWSPGRSVDLARSCLDAIWLTLPKL